jgi:hypothetical protein
LLLANVVGALLCALVGCYEVKREEELMSYVLGHITGWIINVVYIVALVVLIKLATKATEALNTYINDKKSSKS